MVTIWFIRYIEVWFFIEIIILKSILNIISENVSGHKKITSAVLISTTKNNEKEMWEKY